MVDWVSFAVSLTSVAISAAAYRSGQPKLTLTAKGPVLVLGLDEGGLLPVVVVEIVNDGGRAAHINNVLLSGAGLVGKPIRGSTGAIGLEPGGDKKTWIFDYNDLRRQLAEQARTEFRDPQSPVMIYATAQSGRKVLRSEAVQVNPPGVHTAHLTRKDKRQRRYQSWLRPRPMILGVIPLSDRSTQLRPHVMISNSDRGIVRPGQLALVVEREDGSRSRVEAVPPVRTPPVWGGRSRNVKVPFVEERAGMPGDKYSWVFEQKGHLWWGQPAAAFTEREALDARTRYAEQERLKLLAQSSDDLT